MLRNRQPAIQVYEPREETSVVHKAHPHDSARLHVRGAAAYVDDIREPQGTLHIAIGMADKASGTLRGLDLDAVGAADGVVAVLTAAFSVRFINACVLRSVSHVAQMPTAAEDSSTNPTMAKTRVGLSRIGNPRVEFCALRFRSFIIRRVSASEASESDLHSNLL